MSAIWKDFVKSAQLSPGQGTGISNFNIRLRKEPPKIQKPAIDFTPAYDFYRDIAPEIRMRQLGVDKLPENEEKAFRDILDVPVRVKDTLGNNFLGLHHSPLESATDSIRDWKSMSTAGKIGWAPFLPAEMLLASSGFFRAVHPEYIEISRESQDPNQVLVHELRHALESRIPSTQQHKDRLDEIWGYRGVDVAPNYPGYAKRYGEEEEATTNKEHQFIQYMGLRNKLGRKPTAEEYFNYIKSLDDYAIDAARSNVVNGYQEIADKHRNDGRFPMWPSMIPNMDKYIGYLEDWTRRNSYRNGLLNISQNAPRHGAPDWNWFSPAQYRA